MSTTSAERTTDTDADVSAEALGEYYAGAKMLADNWLQLLSLVGVGPHAASIAASHVISVSIAHLNRANPDAARDLVDELASGLLKYSETLGKPNA